MSGTASTSGTTSLLLDIISWDLTLDASGNLALASQPYAMAQDVATAVRTFLGDCWYDRSLGIDYFGQVLGQNTPLSIIKNLIVQEAQTVPGVTNAKVFITSFKNRQLDGQIQFTDANQNLIVVGLAPQSSLFIIPGSSLGGIDVI